MTDEMIVEAIRAVQVNAPRGAGDASGVGAPAPVANAAAVERFQAAMEVSPAEEAAPVGGIPFADQISATWRTAQDNHQVMLHRIRALSQMQSTESPSAAQLAELQYEVMNLSFQQEVVAKVSDKVSNAIQTLIKNQ